MAIPGTVPISGPVAPTATGDTYPATLQEYNKGGYRSVADAAARLAITAARRAEGMLVYQIDTAETYILDNDLVTWSLYSPGGIVPTDVMTKAVYDPNDDGIVVDSDALEGQAGAYYLDRTNHTGTQAQNTIVNLVADLALKEDAANKGAANGYAPLVGGLVPLVNLPPGTPNLYLGLYDASTNTPAILNGVGTAGEFYIANVTGNAYAPVNVTIVNQIVAYDGAVWQVGAVFTGGIAQVTTALGVQTGPNVQIDDTSYIDPSVDRNYVTDDENDALAASSAPSATNEFMTRSATEALIVGSSFFNFDLYSNGETLGDGTSRTLTSLGYTNGSAGAVWTRVDSAYTIDVTTMTIDWIAGQEALLAMEQNGFNTILDVGGRGYVPNQSWDLPRDQTAVNAYKRSLKFTFDLGNSKITNRSATSFEIFKKIPPNQVDAAGLRLDYSYIFKNMYLEGIHGTANDVGIHIGGTNKSLISNVTFAGFHTGCNWLFCLNSAIRDVRIDECDFDGIVSATGIGFWSGADPNNSQSNNVEFTGIRSVFSTSTDMRGAITMMGSRNNMISNCVFEGVNGAQHHIYYNSQNSTTAHNIMHISNCDWEVAGASRATIRVIADSGNVIMEGGNMILNLANTPVFYEVAPYSVGAPIVTTMRNNPDGASAGLGIKFRSVGPHKWWVKNWGIPAYTNFEDAANWATDFGGVLPDSANYNYEPILA